MFVLSMSMVRTLEHFYLNLSNLYMALVMVAAMGVIMLISMWGMFRNERLNVFLLGAFAIGFLAVLTLGRSEAFVGDEQFLKVDDPPPLASHPRLPGVDPDRP